MKWEKASETLKELLSKAMMDVDCEKRVMFGYPAYFINSRMFIGLFENSIFLRLSPAQINSLSEICCSIQNLEPMKGRPMKDYFILPPELYNDEPFFKSLILESAEYTVTLPPKVNKLRKK